MGTESFPDYPHEYLRTWTLTHRDRPWTLNDANAGGARGVGGVYGRAALTRTWRTVYGDLCRTERVPALEWAIIEVVQLCRDGRMPDIGACMPAVKAAVDGLVDADVLPNDTGLWIHSLNFKPPQIVGYDALVLRVSGPVVSASVRAERELAVQAKMLRTLRRANRR